MNLPTIWISSKEEYPVFGSLYAFLSTFWAIFGTFLFIKRIKILPLSYTIIISVFFLIHVILCCISNYLPDSNVYITPAYLSRKISLLSMLIWTMNDIAGNCSDSEKVEESKSSGTSTIIIKIFLGLSAVLIILATVLMFLFSRNTSFIVDSSAFYEKTLAVLSTVVELALMLASISVLVADKGKRFPMLLVILLSMELFKEATAAAGIYANVATTALAVPYKAGGWICDMFYTAIIAFCDS